MVHAFIFSPQVLPSGGRPNFFLNRIWELYILTA